MTATRPFLALPALALLVACGSDTADDSGGASNEVLEGSISDAMLPVDRVRSEPPLEDPEAFAEARSPADSASRADEASGNDGSAEGDEPVDEGSEDGTPATAPVAVDE